jgi:hypothetical protein
MARTIRRAEFKTNARNSSRKLKKNAQSKSFANMNSRRSERGNRSSLGIKTLTLKCYSVEIQTTDRELSSLSNSPIYVRAAIRQQWETHKIGTRQRQTLRKRASKRS